MTFLFQAGERAAMAATFPDAGKTLTLPVADAATTTHLLCSGAWQCSAHLGS
jgi:hypothetical protein